MSDKSQNLLVVLAPWATRQYENFTTEAFIHLLNHLVTHQPVIARKLLDLLTDNRLPQYASDSPKIKVNTQEHIHGFIPDITISSPDFYGIVEVKVDSPHSSEQIASYREILSSHKDSITCITFLGRYTYPNREIQPDKIVRWYEVATVLEAIDTASMDAVSSYLVDQFLGYMGSLGLVLPKVNLAISSGVRSFIEKYDTSIPRIQPHMRSLKILSPYEELKPLCDLLDLMHKALKNLKLKAYFGAMDRSNWIGYSLENMDYFFVIYLDEPETVSFETYNYPFDKILWESSSYKKIGKFRLDPRLDIRGWQNSYKLDQAFFSASNKDQLESLENFLHDSLKITQCFRRS